MTQVKITIIPEGRPSQALDFDSVEAAEEYLRNVLPVKPREPQISADSTKDTDVDDAIARVELSPVVKPWGWIKKLFGLE